MGGSANWQGRPFLSHTHVEIGPRPSARYPTAMGIRFSLKWLLAATVYVALAAAALTQSHWAWADALWLVSFVAVCYAAALAINAREVRQARAIGFLIGSVLFATVNHFSNDGGPIARLVMPNQSTAYPVLHSYGPPPGYFPPMIASGTFSATPVTSPTTGTLSVTTTPRGVQPPAPMPYIPPAISTVDWEARLRAANAIGVVVAGAIGVVLSAIAYRQHHRASDLA
jgi:hypothetical protein